MENKNWKQSLADWVKNVIPSAMVVVVLVYKYMKKKLLREEVRHEDTKLQKEYLENQMEIHNEFGHKSDNDIINDAIRDGKRFRSSGSKHDS